MGILDSLKKATGLGLSANEHYDRAFEKGVLLGPAKYGEAVGLFENAAKKAAEAGNPEMETRSLANASLYKFISGGDAADLSALDTYLQKMNDIEQIGSRSETMSASGLLAEVRARLAEEDAGHASVQSKPDRHEQAALAFKPLFQAPLVTYKFQHRDQHIQTGQQRFFFHQGMASLYAGMLEIERDPEVAAQHFSKAVNGFKQCSDQPQAAKSQDLLLRARQRRTCWMCQRELQGEGTHFRTYPAHVTPYIMTAVQALGQDVSSVDREACTVILCDPCGSALEHQADLFAVRRANELRSAFESRFAAIEGAVQRLANAVEKLQSVAHHH